MDSFKLLVALIYSRLIFPLIEAERQRKLNEDDYSPDYYYVEDELPFFEEFDEIQNPRAKEIVIKNKDKLIHENQYPYIVGITNNELILRCLGFLVTATDVLTTFTCVYRIKKSSSPDDLYDSRLNLRVIVKTPIVKWLKTSNAVWSILTPRSCKTIQRCSYDQCIGNRNRHDLALLTTEYFELWYGYVETLPRAFISNRLWYDQSFKGCFVTGVMFSAQSFVLLKKVNFTMNQKLAPPTNGFVMPMLVGQAAESDFGSILPGSALMCSHRERFLPVGIYAGRIRLNNEPGSRFDLRSILTENLTKVCYDPMKDILQYLDQPWFNESDPKPVFGLVLVFQNVFEWVDASTYELKEQSSTLIELSSGFRLEPELIVVFPMLLKSLFLR